LLPSHSAQSADLADDGEPCERNVGANRYQDYAPLHHWLLVSSETLTISAGAAEQQHSTDDHSTKQGDYERGYRRRLRSEIGDP
jgi:hypothetical protein